MTTVLILTYILSGLASAISLFIAIKQLRSYIKKPIYLCANTEAFAHSKSSLNPFYKNGNAYVELPPQKGKRFIYGRSKNARIQAPSSQLTVSAEQFCIYWETGWKLKDMDSMNGTYLNGVKLPPNTTKRIHIGDIISVGPTEFHVAKDYNT